MRRNNKPARLAWASLGALQAAAIVGCGGGDPAGEGGGGGVSASSQSSSSSSSAAVGPSSGAGGSLPSVFTVTGVVTDGDKPVGGAIVMQGGSKPALETNPDGTFSIEMTTSIPGTPTVVAAKEGYRTAGLELDELPDAPIELVLYEAAPPDNASYVYGPPGVGDAELDGTTAVCGHCHTTLVAQFQGSAHAKSTRDPLVQDLYAGTTRKHADATSCEAAGGIWRRAQPRYGDGGRSALLPRERRLAGSQPLRRGGRARLRRSGAARGAAADGVRGVRGLPRRGARWAGRWPGPARGDGDRVREWQPLRYLPQGARRRSLATAGDGGPPRPATPQ